MIQFSASFLPSYIHACIKKLHTEKKKKNGEHESGVLFFSSYSLLSSPSCMLACLHEHIRSDQSVELLIDWMVSNG